MELRKTPTPAATRPRTRRSSAPPRPSSPRARTTISAPRSIRSPPSTSGRRRSCRRWSSRWIMLQVVGQCDNGYACVYQNNLSWSSPTTPLPAEAHPRIVFESSVRRRRQHRRPPRPRCARRPACSTSFKDDSPPATQPRSPRSREGRPLPRHRPRSGAPHSEGRGGRGGESVARPRTARGRAREPTPTTRG